MKRLRIVVSGGLLAVAVAALEASGPLPTTDMPPQGSPGPWQEVTTPVAVTVQMHYPDFDSAIPRTARTVKPIPENNDRDTSFGLSPSHTARGGGRSKPSGEAGDKDAESGFLDSWLLPTAEGGSESSGWGWLADSAAAEVNGSRSASEQTVRSGGEGAGESVRFGAQMDIGAQTRRELDLDVHRGLFDDEMGSAGDVMNLPSREAATGTENGWVSPSWR